jgi:hypothetical protein
MVWQVLISSLEMSLEKARVQVPSLNYNRFVTYPLSLIRPDTEGLSWGDVEITWQRFW